MKNSLLIIALSFASISIAQQEDSNFLNIDLHLAAARGNLDEIKELVAKGADLENRSLSSGATALFLATDRGQIAAIKLLAGLGAKLDAEDDKGNTPLIIAAYANDLEAINALVAAGANVNPESKIGRASPLSTAALWGHVQAIETLLSLGAKVDLRAAYGKDALATPLFLAAVAGKADSIRKLSQFGASLHYRAGQTKATPLHVACHGGHLAAAKTLVDLGADIDAVDNVGLTPAAYAFQTGQARLVEFLLSSGAKRTVNIKGTELDLAELPSRLGLGNSEVRDLANWHKYKNSIFTVVAIAVVGVVGKIIRGIKHSVDESVLKQRKKDRILSAKDKEKGREHARKSFKSDYFSRPFFGEGGRIAPMPFGDYTDALLEKYVAECEQSYFDDLARQSEIESSEEEVVVAAPRHNDNNAPARTSTQKNPAARKPKAQQDTKLPERPTLILQTRKFAQALDGRVEAEQRLIQKRITEIRSNGDYGDLKHIGWVKVVNAKGETIDRPFFEIRIYAMRIYVMSMDGKALHLLLLGDKTRQENDISSLKSQQFLS